MASQYGALALGFAQSIVMARMLGPRDLGLISTAVAFPALIFSLLSVKSVSVVTRYVAQYHGQRDGDGVARVLGLGLRIDVGIALLAFAVVLVGIPLAIESAEVRTLAYLFACTVPFLALDGPSMSVLQGTERFRRISGVQIAQALVSAALVGVAVAVDGGVLFFAVVTALGTLTTSLLLGASALWGLRRDGYPLVPRDGQAASPAIVREIAGQLGWLYLWSSLASAALNLPPLLIERGAGLADAGYFRTAVTLMTAATMPMLALGRVLYPKLCRDSSQPAHDVARGLLRASMRTGLPLALVLAAGLPLLPWAVELAYGSAYLPMVAGLRWMVLAVAVDTVFFWLQPHFFSRGYTRAYVLSYVLIPLGMLGAVALLGATFEIVATSYAAGRIAFILLTLLHALRPS